MRVLKTLLALTLLLLTSSAWAIPFEYARIGDQDGFGWPSTTGLVRATRITHTTPADTDGNQLLQQGEFLPDLNKDGRTSLASGDEWDNRSAAELSNTANTCVGCIMRTTASGSNWTDLALSTTARNINWPDSAPAAPNNAQFIFDFSVAQNDIVPGSTIFFNMVFGDYDVRPAQVTLGFAHSNRTVGLNVQSGTDDGLIQAVFTTITFDELFTAAGTDWNGFVKTTFVAFSEPYLAFDFVELSLDSIPPVVPPTVTEPTQLVLLCFGLMGLVLNKIKPRFSMRRA